jgi:hypothetical protein
MKGSADLFPMFLFLDPKEKKRLHLDGSKRDLGCVECMTYIDPAGSGGLYGATNSTTHTVLNWCRE